MRCIYIRSKRLHWLPVALALVVAIVGLLGLGWWANRQAADVLSPLLFQRLIIVDAGHGGRDPGVVGGSGLLEKDIDLAIAQKLAELLRLGGASVTMTREQDISLANSKSGDLAARVQLAQELNPTAFISVHGNSYPAQPSVHGAQVFYFSSNEQGRELAKAVQQSLTRQLSNTDRSALPHRSAYILKHIEAPAVVVEVGFLSNPTEEGQLGAEDYQWQLAWAIFDGLLEYLAAPPDAGQQPPGKL